MPITCQYRFSPLDQAAFGKISYDVIAEVLAIRRELGRFFDEKHYKRALALRRHDVILEAPILVSHRDFKKKYFLDVVIVNGGLFEFKAAESITARHKAQLLHYLMLTELFHGMLVNVRPEKVGREYVNNSLLHRDRQVFAINTDQWRRHTPGAARFELLLTELLRDWGTCLDLSLYEEAITHFCGGKFAVIRTTKVFLDGHELGTQNLRFITNGTAFKLTAFQNSESLTHFADHSQRLVNHTEIESLLWANIGRHEVTFRTLVPER